MSAQEFQLGDRVRHKDDGAEGVIVDFHRYQDGHVCPKVDFADDQGLICDPTYLRRGVTVYPEPGQVVVTLDAEDVKALHDLASGYRSEKRKGKVGIAAAERVLAILARVRETGA